MTSRDRAAAATAAAAGAPAAAGASSGNLDEERRQQILRNLHAMLDLGLLHDPAELQRLAAAPQLPAPHPRHDVKRPRVKKEPHEPTRKGLLDGAGGSDEAAAVEPPSVQTPPQRRRAASAARRQEPGGGEEGRPEQGAARRLRAQDDDEDAAKRRAAAQAQKLRELEVEGLAGFDESSASFSVCGSTGNTYQVVLSDAKRTCTCPDHRFRRHDCKHIKLVLAKLHIPRQPKRWREVCVT
ncbi:hypothetical protein HYH02_008029 [Chlamydomonas schloesseri]|uniref:SWIM-type domain-containing protein n=1 Tax=Chlamydomonas schloesseri TaxID=2026947 RepID=A0A836B450_9CHLO|nr:hypothetical protein HYH02_008029 [Chlamydomonas schloesseri]|eukprot:KAG2446873.1 hypothetical protein HYH02_008029 [Chlamydomonas schloesseri]